MDISDRELQELNRAATEGRIQVLGPNKFRIRKARPLIYAAKNRYGFVVEFSSKKAAIAAAKSEQKDGWPSWVKDMRSGQLIWGK